MLSLIACTALIFGVADGDEAKELSELTTKLASAPSYEFTSTSSTERGGDFGGGGRGGEGGGGGGDRGGRGGFGGFGGGEPQPVTGAWKKGQPMHLSMGEFEAYKDGDQLVYKNTEGEWQAFDRESMRGGFGRGGGERGGRGGDEGGGERGGRGGDEGGGERGGRGGGEGGGGERGGDRGGFSSMRAVFTLSGAQAPHEMLKDFGGKLADVTKTETEGVVVYKGALTDDGAASLTGGGGGFGGRGGSFGGGGGGGGPRMETSGDYTIEAKDGVVTSVTFVIVRSGTFGEREFEMTTTREFAFKKVGAAEYEVPEAALAHFEI